MSLKQRYEQEIKWRRANDPQYQVEEMCLAVSEAIRHQMELQGISGAELARKLNVSRAHISQLLNAEKCNLTLRTLARLAAALNAQLEWDFRPILEEPTLVPRWECAGDRTLTPNLEEPYASIALAA